MRTVVVSDLHLGSLLERDVLRRPKAVEALVAEVERSDRLVLLGDTIELLEGRARQASEVARPVLRALGEAAGPGGHVVFVPGNHDHALVRSWVHRRVSSPEGLGIDDQVPRSASTLLSELTGWLEPAGVEVRYPGLWLDGETFATHGHYCDRLLLEASGLSRGAAIERTTPADYERAPGVDAGGVEQPLGEILPPGVSERIDGASGQLRRALLTGIPRLASVPGARNLADLASLTIEQGLHRRAAIPAMAEVARRLGIDATHLVFGHIHRRGPLPADAQDMWRPDTNGPRLLNSGSWVYDSALVGMPTGRPRSYRPGGAVVLEEGLPPACVNLLADVSDDDLRGKV
ncbi:MAG: metallophosphoesterase [Solirubrobacterales bacterium]